MNFFKYILPVLALNCGAENKKVLDDMNLSTAVEWAKENKEGIEEFSRNFHKVKENVNKFIGLCRVCDQKIETLNVLVKDGFIPEKRREEAAKILVTESIKELNLEMITEQVVQGYALNGWNSLQMSEVPLN